MHYRQSMVGTTSCIRATDTTYLNLVERHLSPRTFAKESCGRYLVSSAKRSHPPIRNAPIPTVWVMASAAMFFFYNTSSIDLYMKWIGPFSFLFGGLPREFPSPTPTAMSEASRSVIPISRTAPPEVLVRFEL